MKLSSLNEKIKYFGLRKTLFLLAYLLINRLFYVSIIKFLYLTPTNLNKNLNKSYFEDYLVFLDLKELLSYAKDKSNYLDESFVYEAVNKGDSCMAGINDNGLIMGYGWYSSRPTKISNDLILKFSSDYIYTYKGFTRQEYRGKKIRANNFAKALKYYTSKGYKGFISYVDITNYASLNSVYKTGFKDIGKAFIFRIMGKYFVYVSRVCKDFNISVFVNKKSISSK